MLEELSEENNRQLKWFMETSNAEIRDCLILALLKISADYDFASELVRKIASNQGIYEDNPLFRCVKFTEERAGLEKRVRGIMSEIILDVITQD